MTSAVQRSVDGSRPTDSFMTAKFDIVVKKRSNTTDMSNFIWLVTKRLMIIRMLFQLSNCWCNEFF